MPRFFLTASNIFGGVAYINGADAAHLRVLRVRKGEDLVVCDGNGTDYRCRITEVGAEGVQAEILETSPSQGEPTVACRVYAAFSKGDKMDAVVQKSVEIGAAGVVVFPSARCVSRPTGPALIKKQNRWQKIAQEAAMQCGRGIIPQVEVAPSYEAAICQAAGAALPLFLYEEEREFSLQVALQDAPAAEAISLVTGPEGGFTPEEAAFAKAQGMRLTTMGSRILRCETAPICALSAVMLATGNL